MKPRRRYRIALVGCGDVAEKGHLPALLCHPRFEPAALCDVRPERARLLSRRAGGIPAFADYRALLDRPDIDAALLALHPEVSVDVAVDFLRSGKAVLDEKPLARTLEDGRRLAGAVAAARGVYQVGFVFRYAPAVDRVAAIARRIGRPACYRVGIYDERLDRSDAAGLARIQRILRHSSAIVHEGSHVIDYFHRWNPTGLTRVHAMAVKTSPGFHGPNLWSAQFAVADGSLFHLDVGWLLPSLPRSAIAIAGPRGTLDLDFRTGIGEYARGGKADKVRVGPFTQDWARQLDAFAGAIDRGEARTATVTDGLRALAATTACEQSWRTGRAVNVGNTG